MATVWDGISTPAFPPLSREIKADVCVVGAGIAGLSIAYTLLREGKSVVVLEARKLGRGETGLTSAHLSNALDDRYYALEKIHGPEGARLAAASHTEAIDRIEKISQDENIQCEFKRIDGYLFSGKNDQSQDLINELEAAQRAGLKVTWEEKVPWKSFDAGPAVKFWQQAQFHPLKYIFGLSRAISHLGGKIFADTRAIEFNGGAKPRIVTNQDCSVEAKNIVLATNVPINDRVVVHTKQAAYRSYVIGLKIPNDSVPLALYWDNEDPYHYLRVARDPKDSDKEILIVGGEDHKTGQEENYEQRYRNLETWARKRFPHAGTVVYKWSGQIIEPADGLAFIGKNPMDGDNVFVVTGDSGNGLTHGTIAGQLIPDLISSRPNPYEKLYSPSRSPLHSIKEYLKENLNVLPQYTDWLTPGETKAEGRIEKGSGKVVRRGLQKIAAYRDKEGNFHECSAVCPHLGCIVRWNTAEATWDCPCHGSRFSPEGKVLNGPANSDLPALVHEVAQSS